MLLDWPVRTGSSWRSVRAELLLRFADESWPTRLHVRARLATAPLAEIVAAVGAADHVVDIGCGHGLVSLALATGADRPSVLGVDLDPDKIAIASRAAATNPGLDRLELSVVPTGWRPPRTAAIVLADVLYLLDPAQQAVLVAACAAALAPSGIVVVKEVDDRPRWKAVFARAQEMVAVRQITKRQGNALSAPPARLVRRWLADADLEVTVTRHDTWRPWPHYLAVGRKRGPTGDEA